MFASAFDSWMSSIICLKSRCMYCICFSIFPIPFKSFLHLGHFLTWKNSIETFLIFFSLQNCEMNVLHLLRISLVRNTIPEDAFTNINHWKCTPGMRSYQGKRAPLKFFTVFSPDKTYLIETVSQAVFARPTMVFCWFSSKVLWMKVWLQI